MNERLFTWILAAAMFATTILGCRSGPQDGSSSGLGGGSWGFGRQPKGEPWTIRCIELAGPYAAAQVEQLADALRRTKGIRPDDVFVSHDFDDHSRLYYGTYFRSRDPRTSTQPIPAQMRQDIMLVKELADEGGRRLFLQAIAVRKPQPDVGNPEWVLGRADAAYSLQVAAFVPTEEFADYKKAAAEYCAYLREQGYEAYFHHGPSCSVVTVGSFGADAIIKKRVPIFKTNPRTGERRQVGETTETHYSSEVLALQQNELFKYNYVNGALLRSRHGSARSDPPPSQLVPIP